jgi:hypothetical protein
LGLHGRFKRFGGIAGERAEILNGLANFLHQFVQIARAQDKVTDKQDCRLFKIIFVGFLIKLLLLLLLFVDEDDDDE